MSEQRIRLGWDVGDLEEPGQPPVRSRESVRHWSEDNGGHEPDVPGHGTFPKDHRARLHATKPIERLNGEIKRRTGVVGIFPNNAAINRLNALSTAEIVCAN